MKLFPVYACSIVVGIAAAAFAIENNETQVHHVRSRRRPNKEPLVQQGIQAPLVQQGEPAHSQQEIEDAKNDLLHPWEYYQNEKDVNYAIQTLPEDIERMRQSILAASPVQDEATDATESLHDDDHHRALAHHAWSNYEFMTCAGYHSEHARYQADFNVWSKYGEWHCARTQLYWGIDGSYRYPNKCVHRYGLTHYYGEFYGLPTTNCFHQHWDSFLNMVDEGCSNSEQGVRIYNSILWGLDTYWMGENYGAACMCYYDWHTKRQHGRFKASDVLACQIL